METNSPRPALASHAEKVRRRIAEGVKEGQANKLDQKAKAENRDTRRSSRHNKADRRWERLRASPSKAREEENITKRVRGIMGRVWGFTKIS